jgi:lipopolysaccharide transport system permease protein
MRPTPSSEAMTPVTVIEARQGLLDLDLRAAWHSRELLYFFAWRDVKVRYKQTLMGASWAVVQPLFTIVIFTVVFGKLAKIPSEGLPYSVFALAALLPWTFFAQATGRSANSLVGNAGLITKIYFPRVLVPVSSIALPAVDFAISLLTLAGLMVWYRITPSWGLLALPLFFLLAAITALAVGLFLSPINARYRDVAYAVPFFIQLWMYASPVVYPVSLVPEQWRLLYSLNPMVGIIDGFRWALLATTAPNFTVFTASAAIIVCLFFGALVHFNRMSRTSADVI